MSEKIKKAILSVSNKEGIIDFARGLEGFGVELFSTGGTLKTLLQAGIKARSISDLTQFPEILDGRVKTLHPNVFAGILAKRNSIEHISTLAKYNLSTIDLIAVNLYPFEEKIKNPNLTLEEAVESIDIGGPSMLRASAKNFFDVVPIVDPKDYPDVLKEIGEKGDVTLKTRARLAVKVFRHISHYDSIIADYIAETEILKDEYITSKCEKIQLAEIFPELLQVSFKKLQELRYGENNHQRAAFYLDPDVNETSIATAKQIHGKELSYNNICDLETALEMVREFEKPTAVILKHSNPCGVASADTLVEAYRMARDCDPISIFGGIIGLNGCVDPETASEISSTFIEAVVAPDFSGEALEILTKKKNVRLLKTGEFTPKKPLLLLKGIVGGALIMDRDIYDAPPSSWRVVTKRQPTDDDIEGLLFAWKVAKWVKSNAIIFTTKNRTIGIGAGQMSRVDSVKLAISKALSSLENSYLGSDAFFPMRDGIDEAAKTGLRAIIQPGGSIKDEETIKAADEHNLIMLFTGVRHFRH